MKTHLLPLALGALTLAAACTRLDDTPPPQTAMNVRVEAQARDDADRHYTTEQLRGEYRAKLEQRTRELDERLAAVGIAAGSELTEARARLTEASRHLETADHDAFAAAKNEVEIAFARVEKLVDDAAQR